MEKQFDSTEKRFMNLKMLTIVELSMLQQMEKYTMDREVTMALFKDMECINSMKESLTMESTLAIRQMAKE